MACPKCQGKLTWEERSWTTAGEDPGHWRCIACGSVIYPGTTRMQKVSKSILGQIARSRRRIRRMMEQRRKKWKSENVRTAIQNFNPEESTSDIVPSHAAMLVTTKQGQMAAVAAVEQKDNLGNADPYYPKTLLSQTPSPWMPNSSGP